MKRTILIVDDEKEMRDLIRLYMEKENYLCFEAEHGVEALAILEKQEIDLMIIDVMMPQLDGFSLAEQVRKTNDVAIIFLTAKTAEEDKIHGLRLGGDDYMTKPFSPQELTARIEAVLRRFHKHDDGEESDDFTYKQLVIDSLGRKVTISGSLIPLTYKEYELLNLLVKNSGHVFSREHLLEKVWGLDYSGTERTVDTHIKTLRIKLLEYGDLIKTVWGVGYKFEV